MRSGVYTLFLSVMMVSFSYGNDGNVGALLRAMYAPSGSVEMTEGAVAAIDRQILSLLEREVVLRGELEGLDENDEEKSTLEQQIKGVERARKDLQTRHQGSFLDLENLSPEEREEILRRDEKLAEMVRKEKNELKNNLRPGMSEQDYYDFLRTQPGALIDSEQMIELHLTPRSSGRFGGGRRYVVRKRSGPAASELIRQLRHIYSEDASMGRISIDYDARRVQFRGKEDPLARHTSQRANSRTLGNYQRMDEYGRLYHITEIENYLRYGTIPNRFRPAYPTITPITYVSFPTAIILWRRALIDEEAEQAMLEAARRTANMNFDAGAEDTVRTRSEEHASLLTDTRRLELRGSETERIQERMRDRLLTDDGRLSIEDREVRRDASGRPVLDEGAARGSVDRRVVPPRGVSSVEFLTPEERAKMTGFDRHTDRSTLRIEGTTVREALDRAR